MQCHRMCGDIAQVKTQEHCISLHIGSSSKLGILRGESTCSAFTNEIPCYYNVPTHALSKPIRWRVTLVRVACRNSLFSRGNFLPGLTCLFENEFPPPPLFCCLKDLKILIRFFLCYVSCIFMLNWEL